MSVSGQGTGLLPRALIAIATRALPRGVSRDRYRREFAAELSEVSSGQQLTYAFGVWAHVWALRVVLVKGIDALHRPFLCRTNLYHHWRKHVSAENISFKICARCGKEKGSLDQTTVNDTGMAVGWLNGGVM